MEKSVLNPKKILWLSPSRPNNSLGDPWSLIYCCDIGQAKFVAKSEAISVVVVDSSIGEGPSLGFFSFLKLHKPAVSRVALTDSTSEAFLEKLVNEAAIFRCFDSKSHPFSINGIMEDALKQYTETNSQQQIFADITVQNKKLEELTQNLEFLVEERTKSIESSRDEVAKKLRSRRELVAFIKELSLASIVDDWLLIVGTEVRAFHGIGFPFLAFVPPNGIRRVITFRGKDLVEVEAPLAWPQINEMRKGNREDQVFLANLFGRPVANTLAVPLGKGEGQAVIYFEYTFLGNKLREFSEFVTSRLQAMILSLDRILLEQQTRYASKQWESTFDSLLDPVSIIDLDYQVIRSNKSFYALKKKDVCHKLFAKRDEVCQGCPIPKSLATGVAQSGRIRIGDKIFEASSFPVSAGPGTTATNFINYYADITHERKLFSRLVQNEKMVALGSLAGNIAHELNNPLTGIRSLAQFLQVEADKLNKTELKADLKEIERAAERSQSTIKNLLEFTQPITTSDLEIVGINEIINRTIPMIKAGMRDHRSDLSLSNDELKVKVNVQLLQQVIFNIVLNACQAMPEPGALKITTERNQGDVEISIEDTGHGIAKEDLEHIFEPFFTTKERGQGTGIGLSMSKSIIERFGGKILVESILGQGTKMMVRLPLAG